jgi:hypothetical protein
MCRGLHDVVGLRDPAIRTDQVRDAPRIVRVLRITRLEHIGALVEAEQLEREAELLGERAVLLDRIEARPEDDDVLRSVLADSITESVALERSTRGVGLGIEPEQHVRPGVVGESYARAVVRGDVEVGCERSFGEHA